MRDLMLNDGPDTHPIVTTEDLNAKMLETANALENLVPKKVRNSYTTLNQDQAERLEEARLQLNEKFRSFSDWHIYQNTDHPLTFLTTNPGHMMVTDIDSMNAVIGEEPTIPDVNDLKFAAKSYKELENAVLIHAIQNRSNQIGNPSYDRVSAETGVPSLREFIEEIDKYTNDSSEGIETRRKFVTVMMGGCYDTIDIEFDNENLDGPKIVVEYSQTGLPNDLGLDDGTIVLNLESEFTLDDLNELRALGRNHIGGTLGQLAREAIQDHSITSEVPDIAEIPEPEQLPELLNPQTVGLETHMARATHDGTELNIVRQDVMALGINRNDPTQNRALEFEDLEQPLGIEDYAESYASSASDSEETTIRRLQDLQAGDDESTDVRYDIRNRTRENDLTR